MKRRSLLMLLLTPFAARASGDTVLDPDVFLDRVFHGGKPEPQTLWLDAAIQKQLRPIFHHNYPQARLRYWRDGQRTAWILEDVGKEFPITAGFVVSQQQIERAQLLIYRESRGGEIRFPSFLSQFAGQHLQSDQLEPDVDGISGATLSVDAMRRMARAALTLDKATPS